MTCDDNALLFKIMWNNLWP